MTRRRRRKSKLSIPLLLVTFLAFVLFVSALSHDTFGRFLLACFFVSLPALFVFLKVYPHWAQMKVSVGLLPHFLVSPMRG